MEIQKIEWNEEWTKLCFPCKKCKDMLNEFNLDYICGEGFKCMWCGSPITTFAKSEKLYKEKKFENIKDDLLGETFDPDFEINKAYEMLMQLKVKLVKSDLEENGEKVENDVYEVIANCMKSNKSTEDYICKLLME